MIIYKTTNHVNGKIYIGYDSKNRTLSEYAGSGRLLNFAIEKYGIENFSKEILEYVTEDNWEEREIFWVNEFSSTDRKIGYNITKGGDGGDTFSNNPNKEAIRDKHRESTRKMMLARGGYLKDKEKQIEACKKGNMVRTANGYRHSEETKRKLSESLSGREFTEEWKKNISEATKVAMSNLNQKELQLKALEGRKKAWAKRDEDRKKKLEEILKLGLKTSENIKLLGVSIPTYYKTLRMIQKKKSYENI